MREIGKERGGGRESRSEEKYEGEMKRERDFSRMTKERKPGEVKMETQRETCVEKERVARRKRDGRKTGECERRGKSDGRIGAA